MALLRFGVGGKGNHRVAAASLTGWMGATQCGQEEIGAGHPADQD